MPRKGLPCDPEAYSCPLERHYEDKHHVIPRWLGRIAAKSPMPESYKKLVREYIEHPMNHVVGCRWIHATELDKQTPNVLPAAEQMAAEIENWRNSDQ